jgi:transcriptional regulator with XRE-family HTH domain
VTKITLSAARVNAGFSQKEAAKELNISNSTLCNWEKGKTFPDQPMIEKLCNLYGVSYDMINFAP